MPIKKIRLSRRQVIRIEPLNHANLQDLYRCDNHFIVDSRLVLSIEDNKIHFSVIPVQPTFEKHYPPPEEIDQAAYLEGTEKTVFLAYLDGQVAGQILLHKHWNRYAYIQDIAVDQAFRRQGIGRALMDRAVSWAKKHALPGITLETQDINVGACRFYERYGFKLGGFDRYLYHAIPGVQDEIALYWYLIF